MPHLGRNVSSQIIKTISNRIQSVLFITTTGRLHPPTKPKNPRTFPKNNSLSLSDYPVVTTVCWPSSHAKTNHILTLTKYTAKHKLKWSRCNSNFVVYTMLLQNRSCGLDYKVRCWWRWSVVRSWGLMCWFRVTTDNGGSFKSFYLINKSNILYGFSMKLIAGIRFFDRFRFNSCGRTNTSKCLFLSSCIDNTRMHISCFK